MMQSVALNESCYHDDDYVVVEVAAPAASRLMTHSFDPMAGIVDCDDDDDEASYDYCDDVAVCEATAAVPSIIEGRSLPYVNNDDDTLYIPVRADDEDDQQALLEMASSMLNEITGLENGRDFGGDEIHSTRISSTKLDFTPSLSSNEEKLKHDIYYPVDTDYVQANQQHHIIESVVQDSASSAETLILVPKDIVPVVEPSFPVTASNDPSSKNEYDAVDEVKTTQETAAIAEHQPETNSISRLTNKKRRKQLKLAKKSAAAAAAAVNLATTTTLNSSSSLPPKKSSPMMRLTTMSRRSGRKQQIAPNVVAVTCATQSLESYRADLHKTASHNNSSGMSSKFVV